MTRLERKLKFINEMAHFLAGRQAELSMKLGMTGAAREEAQQWGRLRDLTLLQGYPSVQEAEEILKEFLL